jgi:hypothetical protein
LKKDRISFFFHALVFDYGGACPELSNSTDKSGEIVSNSFLTYIETVSDYGLLFTNLVGCGVPGSRRISFCSQQRDAKYSGRVMS